MIASIIGPGMYNLCNEALYLEAANYYSSACGSWLVDPFMTNPSLLGLNSIFGGIMRVEWIKSFPYALPALLSAFSMLFIGLVVFLMVEEVFRIFCKVKCNREH